MARYIVNTNAQPTGEHEVHNEDICNYLPEEENRKYLGNFDWCQPAVDKAKETYPNSDGCAHCCPDCHTR